MRTVEDALQRVVIAGGDGIELVIVTARAANREAQVRGPEIVDRVRGLGTVRAHCFSNVAGGNNVLPVLRLGLVGKQVAGNLLADETVVRLVLIERRDHVVAILVGLLDGIVTASARGICVAHNVKPHTAPTLAIARRSEEPVDYVLVGLRRSVGKKCIDLLRRGRQTGYIVG